MAVLPGTQSSFCLFFPRAAPPSIFPSFPTRRSSDLLEPPFPTAMGVLYCSPAPSYEREVYAQAGSQQGPADLDVLLRSEEHTSELQSRLHLVCRLLLEKKKGTNSPPRKYLAQ